MNSGRTLNFFGSKVRLRLLKVSKCTRKRLGGVEWMNLQIQEEEVRFSKSWGSKVRKQCVFVCVCKFINTGQHCDVRANVVTFPRVKFPTSRC